MARQLIGSTFCEIYIKSSLATVIKRDIKGLYKKALEGKIDNFIGIDSSVPYQPPKNPNLILDTERETKSVSIKKILKFVLDKKSDL